MELLARDGPNTLSPPKETPEIVKFLKQMVGGFSILLWVGAILCWIAYGIQYSSDKSASLDNVRHGGLWPGFAQLVTGCVCVGGGGTELQAEAEPWVGEEWSPADPSLHGSGKSVPCLQ